MMQYGDLIQFDPIQYLRQNLRLGRASVVGLS
jgi:hypothetical protein